MPPRKNNPGAPFVAKPTQAPRANRGIIDAYKTKAGAPTENDRMLRSPDSLGEYLNPAGETEKT